MNKVIATLLILITCSLLNAQEIVEKRYYKNKYLKPAKSEKQAKLVEIIMQENGDTLRHELREIKTNKLVQVKLFKNRTPIGHWVFTMEYALDYSSQEYEGIQRWDLAENSYQIDMPDKFEAPVFPEYDNDFRSFIAKHLQYPYEAAVNEIQGRVLSQFILDENGKILYFSILKSVNPELDKEAARVVLISPLWTPAKVDGKPVKVHIIVPIVFVLQY